jgi:hypothetical protein
VAAASALAMDKMPLAIYEQRSLLICADLANASKHFILKRPKANFTITDAHGIHLDQSKKISQTYYYIVCPDRNDPYYGMEIRELFAEARQAWERIINIHYLSIVETWRERGFLGNL